MATLILQMKASARRWGLVEVRNPDGTLDRRFKITATEYDALALPGAGAPPGVTIEEWTETYPVTLPNGVIQRRPRAVAYGKALGIGDVEARANGDLIIKLAESLTATNVEEIYLLLNRSAYMGTPPNITVPDLAAARLIGPVALRPTIGAITNGRVT